MTVTKWLYLIFIFGVIIALFLLYDKIFPPIPFSLNIDRQQAIHIAKSFISKQGYSFKGYKQAVVFGENRYISYFLQKIDKFEEARQIYGDKFLVWFWNIRYFKLFQKEEFRVSINPESGDVIYFSHLIPKEKRAKDVTGDKAKQLSYDFLKKQGIDLSKFSPLDYRAIKRPYRLDHFFSLGYEPEGFQNAKIKYDVGIYGNRIGRYASDIIIPEKFNREYTQRDSFSSVLVFSSSFIAVFLFIGCFIYSIIFTKKGYNLAWRNSLFLSLFIFLLMLGVFFNNFSSVWLSYDPSTSFSFFIFDSILIPIFGLIVIAGAFILIFAVGEKLSNIRWKKDSVSFLRKFSYLKSKQFADKILLGYTLGAGILVFLSIFYFICQKYFKIWVFITPVYSEGISGKFPFIIPITSGVFAALTEEFLFRAVSISICKRIFRFTWVAIVFSAIIWGMGHVTIDVLPLYIRIIEIAIIGVILGIFFLRFGIETTIFSHFFIDAILISLFFINAQLTLSGIMALFFTLLPLLTLFKKHNEM